MTDDQNILDFSKKQSASQDAAAKEAFARRLYKLMLDRGLTQSDLARKAGLERNRISQYVRADSKPGGLYLKKLADALGVKPTDLWPDERLGEGKPAYSITVSADGKTARLTADVKLPAGIGAQIVALFGEHAIADRD